jgi:hypothetical protein
MSTRHSSSYIRHANVATVELALGGQRGEYNKDIGDIDSVAAL